MSQQGDHPIIPGIQSLSDAAVLVAAESTRSVVTHVELETRSEQELIQEAITNAVPPVVGYVAFTHTEDPTPRIVSTKVITEKELSSNTSVEELRLVVKDPPTVMDRNAPTPSHVTEIETPTDIPPDTATQTIKMMSDPMVSTSTTVAVEPVDVSLIPVHGIVAGEEIIVTGELSVTKDDEPTISKVSVPPIVLPKAQESVTSGTKDDVESIVKEPNPKATGVVIDETTTGTKDDEETISKGSVQESPLPKVKGAATGEISDTKDDSETIFKPPAEQSPLRKAEVAVSGESDQKTSSMEHAKLSSPPTAKGQKKMLQIQLQKPRKKVELPSQKKGAIAQANAAAIQDAVSRKTRSNVKGDISSRTRQSSTHTAPLLEKKRSSYRKQKGSPSKALAANNPEEGPLSKKAKRSPSKPKQKVSPAQAKCSPSKAQQKVSPAKAPVSNKPEVGSKPRKSSPTAKAVTTRITKGKKYVASADDTPKDTDVTTRREPILSTRKASPKGKTTTSRREPIVATGKSSPKVKANTTPSTKGKKSPIVDDLEEDVNSDDEDDSVSTTTSTSIVSQPTVPSKKKVSKKKLGREPIVKSKKKPPSKQLSEASIPKDSGGSGNDESFSVLSHTKSLREPIVVPPKKSKKVSPKKVIKKYISSPSESETEELQVSGEVTLLPASIAEQTGKLEDPDTALLVVAVQDKPASGVVTADISTLDAVSAGGVIGASLDGESGVPSTVLRTIDATQAEPASSWLANPNHKFTTSVIGYHKCMR